MGLRTAYISKAGDFTAAYLARAAREAEMLATALSTLDNLRDSLLGDALGVVTAMFYAWYLLSVKGLRDRGAGTLLLMAVGLMAAWLPARRAARTCGWPHATGGYPPGWI